jgi:ribokinase
MSKPQPRVTVIGSCNTDLVCYAPRMPARGETLAGTDFRTGFGGKGANQAVMAARLGARVSLIAKLGDDTFGGDILRNFEAEGIDTAWVHRTAEAASGVAAITVEAAGGNAIVIVPGANGLLTAREVDAARPAIAGSGMLVCQLEVPVEATLAALRLAREEGVPTLFNPAPAQAELPDDLFALSDIICPNESEAALLTGLSVTSQNEAEAAARALLERGPRTVVLTLGERGVLVAQGEGVRHVPARRVRAVDTTGAGDAFVGSLACLLAGGESFDRAVGEACRIATLSVQKHGAQSSFPTGAEARAAEEG